MWESLFSVQSVKASSRSEFNLEQNRTDTLFSHLRVSDHTSIWHVRKLQIFFSCQFMIDKLHLINITCVWRWKYRERKDKKKINKLLSFPHHSERHFLLGVLYQMKIFCSDWPYLTRNHFSVSVFCSRKFTLKLNLRPEIGLTYAISIVKWFSCFFSFFV